MSSSLSMRDLQNVSAQQWLDRASRIVPRVLALVFVVAIAWQLVQMTWLLLERAPDESVEIAPPPASVVNAPRKTVNVQAVVDAHLFGVQQQAVADASSAPQTQMNLVLAGTWASDDPSKGFAFIGESATSARMYGVGKSVRQGTVLHSVFPDRVILDNNGKLEALMLPRLSSANLTAQFTRPPPRPTTNQFTENLRRMAESNPAAFSEIVRPQPVFANGVQRGYRVYPGRNRQQFAKLGLQPGDLVLAINGTPLDDPQRGMEIFNTMGASDRVTVTVERNGQPQELSLNTAQMSVPESSPPDSGRPRPNSNPSTPN
jgi:general secretion pathway protein C